MTSIPKKFAVIGNPIQHSRSPELHTAFAERTQLNITYQKLFSEIDEFEQTVKQFFITGGQGLNVTVPFKEQAFNLCNILTTRAKTAKAVNTLWMKDGVLHGDNTDGQGLVDAIQALKWPLKECRILILGAGGATRGVIYPLAIAGAKKIVIANRTLARAEQLVNDVAPALLSTELQAISMNELAGSYDLVINATSASLTGDAINLPEDLHMSYAYEMAYGKTSTFLKQANDRHVPNSDGFGMLVGQAIESFYIWNQVRPQIADFL